MTIRAQSADGVIHEFPDGTSDAVVDQTMRAYAQRGGAKPSVGKDVAKSGGSGVVGQVLGVVDSALKATPFGAPINALNLATGKNPASPNAFSMARIIAPNLSRLADYQPQTTLGHAAKTASAMAFNALAPGSAAQRVANVVLPTVGAEGAAAIVRGRGGGEQAQEAARLVGGIVGGAGASVRVGPRSAPTTPPPRTNGNILAEIGVSTTVPQRMGRTAKAVEDLGKRAPILGPAMSGAQDRQIEQLNRGIGLKALQPVGLGIPKAVKPGFEMVQYVDDALSGVYNRAADMVPGVQLDDQLVADAQRIGARRADLAESEARQFDSIIADRLQRLSSGEASGAMVKQIHHELGALQAEAARKGQTTLASMLGETRRAVMGLIERASPEARELIRRADKGWQVYSIMNDAAAQASARNGVFLPGQLNSQVRRAGRAMGSNMTGKGQAPLQDIASAASATIPDSYGNPGTANALGLGAGGVGLLTEPTTTLTAAAGLTAAATPYFLMGRKVLEALPDTPSVEQLQAAEQQLAQLASRDPSVNVLRREIALRLQNAMFTSAGSALAAPSQAPPQ